ncbi:hypothetical protein HYV22_03150 [Candidatus Gottesmanbacteria bacterium]|nr:hypothetical protein [Candidatus Gottesmanbacteria bacterium]
MPIDFEQDVRQLERIINEDATLRGLFAPRMARWRYYGPKGALSTHPATVYAWRATTQTWEIARRVNHRLRRDAKARALRLFTAGSEVQ